MEMGVFISVALATSNGGSCAPYYNIAFKKGLAYFTSVLATRVPMFGYKLLITRSKWYTEIAVETSIF